MPFRSQAQRGLFYAKADRGEISKKTVKHWEDATPKGKKLPEHVKKAVAKISADIISGGKADDKTNSDFDPKQLAMGKKVEREHTSNPALAEEISRDHLEEFGNYYTGLDKMEEELKKGKTAAYQLGIHRAVSTLEIQKTAGVRAALKTLFTGRVPLYHGTSATRGAAIQAKGLLPDVGGGVSEKVMNLTTDNRGLVFTTRSPAEAGGYARSQAGIDRLANIRNPKIREIVNQVPAPLDRKSVV